MATRPLIKESLHLLHLSGVNPHICNVSSNSRLTLSFILLFMVWIDSLLDLIFKWQGLNSMESIAVFNAISQILTKMLILTTQRKNLDEVIHKMNQFWSINKYGRELQNEIKNIYIFARKAMKFMVVILLFGASAYFVLPIFLITKKLPFSLYHPTDVNRSPDYEIVYGLEISASFIGSVCLLGFDFLFVSLIINIVCELKIVKEGFKNIPIDPRVRGDTKQSLRELYKIIEHHNLVLECIKSVREIYSFWLLNIYFYNMIEMCVGLLCTTTTGFSPILYMYAFISVFYMLQLFFYCATGQYLITESENISATIYDTDWWIKTQPKLRKSLVMVIQRTNKVEKLSAGGMFALNLPSFRKVTRAALSVFTLVNAFYRDT